MVNEAKDAPPSSSEPLTGGPVTSSTSEPLTGEPVTSSTSEPTIPKSVHEGHASLPALAMTRNIRGDLALPPVITTKLALASELVAHAPNSPQTLLTNQGHL